MKKVCLLLGVCVITLLGILGCQSDKKTEGKSVQEKKEITIGYPHLRISLPVIIAYENKYFKEQGIDVRLKSYSTAQPMMDAIISGKIDMGGFCALPITFGAMAKSNQQVLFIASMFENNNYPISELLVKDTANIKSILDLKGKRIGILPTRAYEVWAQDILSSNGIDLSSVTISYVKPGLQASSLNDGTVDALFTNDPVATTVKSKGLGFNIGSGLVPQTTGLSPFYFGSFNVREDFAKKNPETVKKVSIAIDKAIEFIEKNQLNSKEIMANIDSLTSKPYLPKAFHEIVKDFPNSKFQKTNSTEESNLLEMKKYYLDKGILPKDISLEGMQYRNK